MRWKAEEPQFAPAGGHSDSGFAIVLPFRGQSLP